MSDDARVIAATVGMFLINALLVWLYDWAFFATVDVWRAALFLMVTELVLLATWALVRNA